MTNPEEIKQILSRIAQGIVEKKDIEIINQALANNEEISFQVGNPNW